jgi:hypothetical protein
MWWWLALVGCGSSVDDVAQRPAPIVLGLTAGVAVAGEYVVLTVTGANPGETVVLFRSAVGPGAGPCPPAAGGACLDLRGASPFRSLVAGPSGAASLTLSLPATAGGTSWLQAARVASPAGTSPVVEVRVYGYGADGDEDVASDADEVLAGTDPDDADSDNDGVLDGIELLRGMDPFGGDTDGDGVPDAEDVLPTIPSVADPFVQVDEVVTPPGASLPDPEFDNDSQRVTWQDWDGTGVWVADVDPSTGDLVPDDGRGQLIASGVATLGWGRNGPEWVQGPTGAELLYTRFFGGQAMVVHATEGVGGWTSATVPGTFGAQSPIGSLDVGDVAPRVRYVVEDGGRYESWWADLSAPAAGGELPRTLRFARWVPGTRLLTGVSREGDIDQVFTIDVDTLAVEQVTTSPIDKGSVFFFEAPELGGELLMYTTHAIIADNPDRVVVYRRIGGVWTPIKEISTPPGFPFVVSPEPFVWGGRSYVSFLATRGQFNFDNGEGQVWLAALAPGDDLLRRVSLPDAVVRKDPEPYAGGDRPWVYYSRILAGGDRVIRRCELGL